MKRRAISSSLLPAWLDASCERHPSYFEGAGALYDSWRAFAHGRGAEPGSPAEFAAAMEARGFACDRLPGLVDTRVRWGVRLASRAAASECAQ